MSVVTATTIRPTQQMRCKFPKKKKKKPSTLLLICFLRIFFLTGLKIYLFIVFSMTQQFRFVTSFTTVYFFYFEMELHVYLPSHYYYLLLNNFLFWVSILFAFLIIFSRVSTSRHSSFLILRSTHLISLNITKKLKSCQKKRSWPK